MTRHDKRDLPDAWPPGRSLAVSVSVMLEGWSDGAAPGIGPMGGGPLVPGRLDRQARSWADYGVNQGVWRLLDALESAGARAVFYVSGIVAERNPSVLDAIVDAGHPVAAHGWAQDIIPAGRSPTEEAADLARCVAAIEAACGVRPRGWLSPGCTPSADTSKLLAGAGFAWQADFCDRDLPRVLETPAGPITAMPFTTEVNDLPLAMHQGREPEAYTRALRHILEGWPSLASAACCLDVTVHAHVFGRPAGAIEFIRALALLRSYQDEVWMTDHHELGTMFATA